MKNTLIVFSVLFLILGSFNMNAVNITSKNEIPTCDDVALYIMDAIENTYGCYEDAEEYNDDFQSLVKACEAGYL